MPLFQRTYQWREKELAQFWDDVVNLLETGEEESNFLGVFVVQQKSINPIGTEELVVIDGQQRLTTIFLTLLAAAEKAEQLNETQFRKNDIQKRYLQCNSNDHFEWFRLEPTPLDRKQCNQIFNNFSGDRIRAFDAPAGKDTGTITIAFELIKKHLDNALSVLGEKNQIDTLKQFLARFLGGIEVVVINLSPGRNAHEVFDRLNNFGMKLQVIDLVRNEIFQKVEKDQEKLYLDKWQPFESELRTQFKNIKDKDVDKKIDGFFWPYLLIQQENAVKTKIFGELRDYWNSLEGDHIGFDAAEMILGDMSEWLPSYFALTLGKKPDGIGESFWKEIQVLNKIPVYIVSYPFLMRLIDGNIKNPQKHSDENCARCCQLIESFIIRRAIVGLQPSGLHGVFKILWKKAGSNPKEVRENLEKGSVEFPSGDRIREEIANGDMYSKKLASYILMEYEIYLQEKRWERWAQLPIPEIDHVMPQTLSHEWLKEIKEEEHEKYKNTWGNLVLLTKSLNVSKSNKSFSEFKDGILKDTLFESTKAVCEESHWGIKEINERNKRLADWAVGRWPNQ